MSEVWAAAVAVVGSVAKGKADQKAAEAQTQASKEESATARREGSIYDAINSQFNAQQDYYYKQLDRSNRQRGLDEFRQYNTVGAPSTIRIQVPNAPTAEGVASQINTLVPQAAPAAKEKRSTIDKIIDPAGLFG